MNSEPSPDDHEASDQPPFLGTWRNVYAAVLAFLSLLIILFYIFTRIFS